MGIKIMIIWGKSMLFSTKLKSSGAAEQYSLFSSPHVSCWSRWPWCLWWSWWPWWLSITQTLEDQRRSSAQQSDTFCWPVSLVAYWLQTLNQVIVTIVMIIQKWSLSQASKGCVKDWVGVRFSFCAIRWIRARLFKEIYGSERVCIFCQCLFFVCLHRVPLT